MNISRLLLPNGALKVRPPELADYRLEMRYPLLAAQSMRRAAMLKRSLSVEFPDGSIAVDAPDLPQPTSWSCALCAASLARLYGVGPDSVSEFLKGMGTKRSGTDPVPIARYLRKLGLKAYIKRNMTKDLLLDLLDQEIPSILAIQAWADDPSVYDDPNNNTNGHYVAAIGYFSGPPKFVEVGSAQQVVMPASRRILKPAARRIQRPKPQLLRAQRAAGDDEDYLLFMDPSILCRYGYMSWTNLERRWHDMEGTRRKPRFSRHLGIIVDPNGHEPIHSSVADEIM